MGLSTLIIYNSVFEELVRITFCFLPLFPEIALKRCHPIGQGNSKSSKKMIFRETLALLSSKSLDSGSVHVWERKLSGINRTHSAHGTVSPDTKQCGDCVIRDSKRGMYLGKPQTPLGS